MLLGIVVNGLNVNPQRAIHVELVHLRFAHNYVVQIIKYAWSGTYLQEGKQGFIRGHNPRPDEI